MWHIHTAMYGGVRVRVAIVNTVVYGRWMTARLSAEDWVKAGLAALAAKGFTAVRADVLAREMNVSRGSFYWHFKNIEAFYLALMQRWEAWETASVIAQVERVAPGGLRLAHLVRLAFTGNSTLEMAMRNWAASYAPVSVFIEKIDALRLGFIERLLGEAGLEAAMARGRARIIYWTYLGFIASKHRFAEAELETLIDSILLMARPG